MKTQHRLPASLRCKNYNQDLVQLIPPPPPLLRSSPPPPPPPRTLQAEEFRSWEVIRSMLEGFKTLPDLLAARSADYSPPGFWELFERETHATRSGSGGQLTKAVQVCGLWLGHKPRGREKVGDVFFFLVIVSQL